MFLADTWKDYEVIDTGDGEKLERWGNYILRRPDPQTIWPKADESLWREAQAHYHRSDRGGGEWEFMTRLPDRWRKLCFSIQYRGRVIRVCMNGEKTAFSLTQGEPLTLRIDDREYTLGKEELLVGRTH